jgi:hypothetical protein
MKLLFIIKQLLAKIGLLARCFFDTLFAEVMNVIYWMVYASPVVKSIFMFIELYDIKCLIFDNLALSLSVSPQFHLQDCILAKKKKK